MFSGIFWQRAGAAARPYRRLRLFRHGRATRDNGAAPRFKVAIVGSGPAGLAAAGQAVRRGLTHILLERGARPANTVFSYQKGKPVMALPEKLPLRSPNFAFEAGSKESVIKALEDSAKRTPLNIQLNAEVIGIKGRFGNFELSLANGDKLYAEVVVLAIGMQSNRRRLSVPGADLRFVQYELDDPDVYHDERIVVVGAGDAGVENALGLARNNTVTLVNRGTRFPRAKRPNAHLIEAAIARGDVGHRTYSRVKRIEPGAVVLATREGEMRLQCDRVIARLGALPPRGFLEACGVGFTGAAVTALPLLSENYESTVPGLYIVGALTGHSLLKHCLNQGFEVIENILGHPVDPIFDPGLQELDEKPKMPVTAPELNGAGSSFIIDINRCIQCGNCETACAETHGGIGSLNIEGGPTFGHLHVADSCLHCADAPCLSVECPAPDGIRRGDRGEVYVADNCIGCGNCAKACPYGFITMARAPAKKPHLLKWLLFGHGPGPGEDRSANGMAQQAGGHRARKCDICRDVKGGPACVRACPVGAAIRGRPGHWLRPSPA